jgi:hypothetical protein
MQVCELYRIRHSEFLQWPTSDRHKAVMYQVRKGECCPDCGSHPELTDPRRGGHPDAVVMAPVHCRVCEIRDRGMEGWERDKKKYPLGTTLRLQPAPPPATEPDTTEPRSTQA